MAYCKIIVGEPRLVQIRLATTNISRVSIYFTKFFARSRDAVDGTKVFLSTTGWPN